MSELDDEDGNKISVGDCLELLRDTNIVIELLPSGEYRIRDEDNCMISDHIESISELYRALGIIVSYTELTSTWEEF